MMMTNIGLIVVLILLVLLGIVCLIMIESKILAYFGLSFGIGKGSSFVFQFVFDFIKFVCKFFIVNSGCLIGFLFIVWILSIIPLFTLFLLKSCFYLPSALMYLMYLELLVTVFKVISLSSVFSIGGYYSFHSVIGMSIVKVFLINEFILIIVLFVFVFGGYGSEFVFIYDMGCWGYFCLLSCLNSFSLNLSLINFFFSFTSLVLADVVVSGVVFNVFEVFEGSISESSLFSSVWENKFCIIHVFKLFKILLNIYNVKSVGWMFLFNIVKFICSLVIDIDVNYFIDMFGCTGCLLGCFGWNWIGNLWVGSLDLMGCVMGFINDSVFKYLFSSLFSTSLGSINLWYYINGEVALYSYSYSFIVFFNYLSLSISGEIAAISVLIFNDSFSDGIDGFMIKQNFNDMKDGNSGRLSDNWGWVLTNEFKWHSSPPYPDWYEDMLKDWNSYLRSFFDLDLWDNWTDYWYYYNRHLIEDKEGWYPRNELVPVPATEVIEIFIVFTIKCATTLAGMVLEWIEVVLGYFSSLSYCLNKVKCFIVFCFLLICLKSFLEEGVKCFIVFYFLLICWKSIVYFLLICFNYKVIVFFKIYLFIFIIMFIYVLVVVVWNNFLGMFMFILCIVFLVFILSCIIWCIIVILYFNLFMFIVNLPFYIIFCVLFFIGCFILFIPNVFITLVGIIFTFVIINVCVLVYLILLLLKYFLVISVSLISIVLVLWCIVLLIILWSFSLPLDVLESESELVGGFSIELEGVSLSCWMLIEYSIVYFYCNIMLFPISFIPISDYILILVGVLVIVNVLSSSGYFFSVSVTSFVYWILCFIQVIMIILLVILLFVVIFFL